MEINLSNERVKLVLGAPGTIHDLWGFFSKCLFILIENLFPRHPKSGLQKSFSFRTNLSYVFSLQVWRRICQIILEKFFQEQFHAVAWRAEIEQRQSSSIDQVFEHSHRGAKSGLITALLENCFQETISSTITGGQGMTRHPNCSLSLLHLGKIMKMFTPGGISSHGSSLSVLTSWLESHPRISSGYVSYL